MVLTFEMVYIAQTTCMIRFLLLRTCIIIKSTTYNCIRLIKLSSGNMPRMRIWMISIELCTATDLALFDNLIHGI